MASLRDLKKRLKGVQTTGQLAGAMKTVSTAKYARVSAVTTAYTPYAEACRAMFDTVGGNTGALEKDSGAKPLYLLISGNRGLCGGYNSELESYFYSHIVSSEGEKLFAACGKTAIDYCREKGIALEAEFRISDVPSFTESKAVSDGMKDLFKRRDVSSVSFVCQNYINMLKQVPSVIHFLPAENGEGIGDGGFIYIPDAATVRDALAESCLDVDMYSLLLRCATGAQAATMMAMRSAFDNANESAATLETAINRRRQAEVTARVIETASDNRNEGGWN